MANALDYRFVDMACLLNRRKNIDRVATINLLDRPKIMAVAFFGNEFNWGRSSQRAVLCVEVLSRYTGVLSGTPEVHRER
jgi:hypothetical protein